MITYNNEYDSIRNMLWEWTFCVDWNCNGLFVMRNKKKCSPVLPECIEHFTQRNDLCVCAYYAYIKCNVDYSIICLFVYLLAIFNFIWYLKEKMRSINFCRYRRNSTIPRVHKSNQIRYATQNGIRQFSRLCRYYSYFMRNYVQR